MKLDDSVVNSFEKLVNEGLGRDPNKETFVYGAAAVDGTTGDISVQFDGAEVSTPVGSTVRVNDGDRVLVMIKNHQATVISDITSPVVSGVEFLSEVNGIRADYAELGGFVSTAERNSQGNPDFACQNKTTAQGGHAYPISLYSQATGGGYEYEVGMKGDAYGNTPHTNLAFYVKRIDQGDSWSPSNIENLFYVNNSGKLYAKDAVIKGDIEASEFKASKGGMTMQLNAGELKLEDSSYSSGVAVHLSGYSVASFESSNHYCEINTGAMYFKNGQASGYIDGNILEVANDNSGRSCRLTASAAGNAGIYDTEAMNESWIICSNSNKDVYVPHPFRSYNAFDTTLRYPVGSSATANQGISWLGGTGTSTLSVRGNWNSSTDATKTIAVSSSDIRLKKDIADTKVSALDVLKKINLREFTWKEDDIYQPIGVIADELEKIDPLFVVGGGVDENGFPVYKSINTLYLLSYVVKAIQEMQEHDDGK